MLAMLDSLILAVPSTKLDVSLWSAIRVDVRLEGREASLGHGLGHWRRFSAIIPIEVNSSGTSIR